MSRGKMFVVALVVLVVALLFQVMVTPPRAADAPGSAVLPASERQAAPDLALPVEKGKPAVTFASLKGKVVLLDFWATWCGPCRASIPDIEKLYKKYHSQGLEVYGISVDENPTIVPAAASALGMTYPIVLASEIPGIRDKFSFNGIPQLYIIDKSGKVARSLSGYDPSRDVEDEVTKFLKE